MYNETNDEQDELKQDEHQFKSPKSKKYEPSPFKKPVAKVSSICLGCDGSFLSSDPKTNRLCPKCQQKTSRTKTTSSKPSRRFKRDD
jgi:hypothetical protein